MLMRITCNVTAATAGTITTDVGRVCVQGQVGRFAFWSRGSVCFKVTWVSLFLRSSGLVCFKVMRVSFFLTWVS